MFWFGHHWAVASQQASEMMVSCAHLVKSTFNLNCIELGVFTLYCGDWYVCKKVRAKDVWRGARGVRGEE